jgi:serine/threonine protein kinase
MMREIAALKQISHPNVCPLEAVHLNKFKLYLVFPFIQLTLGDVLPSKDNEEANFKASVTKSQVNSMMRQLFCAVDHCHQRGIIHRNIKPKHLLLIPGPNPGDRLEGCQLQLADFALARILDHPPHQYTSEVITLWYRPPEILMGQKNYTAGSIFICLHASFTYNLSILSSAVDIWSCGCIFAELLQGGCTTYSHSCLLIRHGRRQAFISWLM